MPTKNWGESSVWGFSVLGGGSVVLALALMCIEKMGWMPAASASTFTAQLGVFFGFAAIWINYPHAVWSYRLAYGQGPGFVRSHPGTLIFIPILMMLAFGAVYFFRETSIQSHPYLLSLDQAFEWAGIFLNISLYKNLGSLILAIVLILQMVFLGQHYAMQSYGVTLHCARRGSYPLDDDQRRWIRYSMVSIWAVSVLSGYTYLSAVRHLGFEYFGPRFPDLWMKTAEACWIFSLLRVAYSVVWKNWRKFKKLPPLSSAGAYLSIFFWLQPYWYFMLGYHLWIIQFAHCIQYLFFVYWIERSGFMSPQFKGSVLKWGGVVLTVVLLGYSAFEWIPARMDQQILPPIAGVGFFILAFGTLINFHHYFIDAIVWRNPKSVIRGILQNGGRGVAD